MASSDFYQQLLAYFSELTAVSEKKARDAIVARPGLYLGNMDEDEVLHLAMNVPSLFAPVVLTWWRVREAETFLRMNEHLSAHELAEGLVQNTKHDPNPESARAVIQFLLRDFLSWEPSSKRTEDAVGAH